jgi:hypothetical protein
MQAVPLRPRSALFWGDPNRFGIHIILALF